MKARRSPPTGLVLALAALLGACAQNPVPPATQVAALDCAALASEVHAATESQRVAEQQQQDAWKAVVPFAVAARYGQAKAAARESGQRLAELQQHAAQRGCPMP